MKKFCLIAIVTLALVIAGASLAQPADAPTPPEGPRGEWAPGCPPMGGGFGPQWGKDDDDDFMPGGCCDDLKLSDDQHAKLDRMVLAHQTKMMDWHTDMAAARNQMKKLLIADKYDDKAVGETAAKIGNLHEMRCKMMAEHLRKVRDMLTDDQKLGFDRKVLAAGPMGMMGGEHGRRGGPGMGRGMHRPW